MLPDLGWNFPYWEAIFYCTLKAMRVNNAFPDTEIGKTLQRLDLEDENLTMKVFSLLYDAMGDKTFFDYKQGVEKQTGESKDIIRYAITVFHLTITTIDQK